MVLRSVWVAAILMATSLIVQAENLGDRHMKALSKDCAVCHEEQPAKNGPPQARCVACHGDLKKLGNKPLPKGAVNPHLNHVEELYCSDCHHMHKQSENYCLQCHDDAFLGMKVP